MFRVNHTIIGYLGQEFSKKIIDKHFYAYTMLIGSNIEVFVNTKRLLCLADKHLRSAKRNISRALREVQKIEDMLKKAPQLNALEPQS